MMPITGVSLEVAQSISFSTLFFNLSDLSICMLIVMAVCCLYYRLKIQPSIAKEFTWLDQTIKLFNLFVNLLHLHPFYRGRQAHPF